MIYLLLILQLQSNQFRAQNSECVWTFNQTKSNLEVSVDTGKHIMFSEYPKGGPLQSDTFEDLLEIYINDNIIFYTKTKPFLSKEKRPYYRGKITWQTKITNKSYKGYILFKECNKQEKCFSYRQINFSYNGYKWQFLEKNSGKKI